LTFMHAGRAFIALEFHLEMRSALGSTNQDNVFYKPLLAHSSSSSTIDYGTTSLPASSPSPLTIFLQGITIEAITPGDGKTFPKKGGKNSRVSSASYLLPSKTR
jgi:hypothetical protein